MVTGALIAGAAIAGGIEQRRQAKSQRSDLKKERARQALIVEQGERTVTAAAVDQDSEAARRNKRRSSSLLTKDFLKPTLGQPGLTGV